jgi:hypothetical protein
MYKRFSPPSLPVPRFPGCFLDLFSSPEVAFRGLAEHKKIPFCAKARTSFVLLYSKFCIDIMGFIRRQIREKFEENKPKALQTDIRMISGCEDAVSTQGIF